MVGAGATMGKSTMKGYLMESAGGVGMKAMCTKGNGRMGNFRATEGKFTIMLAHTLANFKSGSGMAKGSTLSKNQLEFKEEFGRTMKSYRN